MLMLSAIDAHRLRSRWAEMDQPAIVTGPLLAPDDAANMRVFFDSESAQRRDDDRGRFDELSEHEFPAVIRRCRSIAESVTARDLALERVLLRRFAQGDFQNADDEPGPDDPQLELTLDFSERALGTGSVKYTDDGRAFFEVAQRPGAISLVTLGSRSRRSVPPLSEAANGSAVYRLVLALREP